MSDNTMFVWLADSCYPRQGPQLEKGKTYRAADYSTERVKAWVASGDAKWADVPKKSKVKED